MRKVVWVFFCLAIGLSDPPPQHAAQESLLPLGETVERTWPTEPEAAKLHRYVATLPAGQAVRVKVTQIQKANLIVAALDPVGATLTEVNAMDGDSESELLTFATTNAGRYTLTIRLTDSSPSQGGYRLQVETPRVALPLDLAWVAAQNDYQAGRRAHRSGTGEERRLALQQVEQVVRFWQQQGETQWEAVTLHLQGMLQSDLGDYGAALPTFERALPLKQKLGLRDSESSTRNYLCQTLHVTGHLRRALQCRQELTPFTQEFWSDENRLLHRTDIGLEHMLLGESELALQQFQQVLADQRALGLAMGESLTLQNLGTLYSDRGDFQQALDAYEQALALRRRLNDPRRLTFTLMNLGNLYLDLRDTDKAAPLLEEAWQLAQKVGNKNDLSMALFSKAAIAAERNDLPQALAWLRDAFALAKATQVPKQQALTLLSLGALHSRLREWDKAADYFAQALAVSREFDWLETQIPALRELGRVALNQQQFTKARDLLEQALQLARTHNYAKRERDALISLARLHQHGNQLDEAARAGAQAIALTESARNNILRPNLRDNYFAEEQSPYQLQIETLMQWHAAEPTAGHDAAALQVNERARARSLIELIAETKADLRAGLAPTLLAEEQQLHQQIRQVEQRRLAARPNAPERETLQQEITKLLAENEALQARIRQQSPRYAALAQPQPLTTQQLQQLLDQDTVLLEYALGTTRSTLWVVTAKQITSYALPARSVIETAATKSYELLLQSKQRRYQHDAELALRALSAQVLPAALRLPMAKRLAVVADGALQYVPFGLLAAADGKSLLSHYELVSLPSASSLAALRHESATRTAAPKTLAVFADPVFQPNDERFAEAVAKTKLAPASLVSLNTRQLTRSAAEVGLTDLVRLPFARQEAEEILKLNRDATNLRAFDFTASRATALQSKLDEYRILHFATHGLLNPQHPELSGLALSLVDEAGRPQDGFLRMADLYSLKLNADLVVLSACRTALGKDSKSEGLIGLARGFMYAGTPRVVASLWEVNDAATAELMKRFYQRMLVEKLPPAAALRAAQLSLAQEPRWAAPYYWAGFVLSGEWK